MKSSSGVCTEPWSFWYNILPQTSCLELVLAAWQTQKSFSFSHKLLPLLSAGHYSTDLSQLQLLLQQERAVPEQDQTTAMLVTKSLALQRGRVQPIHFCLSFTQMQRFKKQTKPNKQNPQHPPKPKTNKEMASLSSSASLKSAPFACLLSGIVSTSHG